MSKRNQYYKGDYVKLKKTERDPDVTRYINPDDVYRIVECSQNCIHSAINIRTLDYFNSVFDFIRFDLVSKPTYYNNYEIF